MLLLIIKEGSCYFVLVLPYTAESLSVIYLVAVHKTVLVRNFDLQI